jgi:hypothetical protein
MSTEYTSTSNALQNILVEAKLTLKEKREVIREIANKIDQADGFHLGAEILADIFRKHKREREPRGLNERKCPDQKDFTLFYQKPTRMDGKFVLYYRGTEFYRIFFTPQDVEIDVDWEILFDLPYDKFYDLSILLRHPARTEFRAELMDPLIPVERKSEDLRLTFRPTEEKRFMDFCQLLICGYKVVLESPEDKVVLEDHASRPSFAKLVKSMQKYGIAIQDEVLEAYARVDACRKALVELCNRDAQSV